MRRGIVCVLLIAIALVGMAAPADAVTRKQGAKIARKALGRLTKQNAALLYGLKRVVPAGARVGQGVRPKLERRVKRAVWLYWFDQAPGAAFAHPSVLILVDRRLGRVVRKQKLSWWVTLAGKRLFEPKPKAGARAFPRALAGLRSDCIVTIGDRTDPYFLKGLAAINSAGNRLGVRVAAATTKADLARKIDALANGNPKCTDVMIYIAAHGYAPPGSKVVSAQSERPQVQIKSGAGANATVEDLDSEDIRRILDARRNLTFKLVVDSCFSGRWEILMAAPNLRITLTSSAAGEVTWLAVNHAQAGRQVDGKLEYQEGAPVGTPSAGDDPPPFTKGVVDALDMWATDPNGNDLGMGLGYAGMHREGDKARALGWQHGRTNDRTSERPHGQEAAQPVRFSVAVTPSYRHIGPGSSEVCFAVQKSPRQPLAEVKVTTTGPGVVSQAQPAITNDDGFVLVRVPINDYGKYDAMIDVTASDGGTAQAMSSIEVKAAQGSCPAP